MAMEGFADLRDARRPERTNLQRQRSGRQVDAGTAGDDSLDARRVRSRVGRDEADGTGERAEAPLDGQRDGSSLQRQHGGVRSTTDGVDRMGEAEPAADIIA